MYDRQCNVRKDSFAFCLCTHDFSHSYYIVVFVLCCVNRNRTKDNTIITLIMLFSYHT